MRHKKQLKKIEVRGFKSIRACEFEVRPLNILIGANGSGKSNFVFLFDLLNAITQERLQTFSGEYGANALLHFGVKHTQELDIKLVFGEGDLENGYAITLAPTTDDTLYFLDETYWFHDMSRFETGIGDKLGAGHRETRLLEASAKTTNMSIADHVIDALKRARVYHFHDTSKTAAVKQFHSLDDNEDLRSDASNLAAFLGKLQFTHIANYQLIVRHIRLVAPFFDEFPLRPSPRNPDQIRLEWREVGSDAYFNAHALSDGTLRFMCLATLLLQPNLPAVIIIDEPELGLHPYAITVLAGLLRQASEQSQVIVSTQSVPLVNQFRPEDIVIVDRKDGQSTFSRPDPSALDEWLAEYGMGDLWEKNIIGGRPQPPTQRELSG